MSVAIAAVALATVTSGALRSHDQVIAEIVRAMRAGSATFATMVDRLEHSNVIVYVENGHCPTPHVLSCLTMSASGGGYRYVRVQISLGRVKSTIASQIAHEIAHALEIADAPAVVDSRSLAWLYRRIGYVSGGNAFETSNALRVQQLVSRELLGRRAVPSVSQ